MRPVTQRVPENGLRTGPLVQTRQLVKRFDGLTAVSSLDLVVSTGSIHSVIGPNGAGKTTLFNLISGVELPTEGEILFSGKPLGRMAPHARTKLGIRRTFQNIRLFDEQTVLENVVLGQHVVARSGLESLFTIWGRSEKKHIRDAYRLLDELGIGDLAHRKTSELAYGPRRLVEIARALASEPTLLLLDEPTSGMNHSEIEEVTRRIRGIRDLGITIILIEHHMEVVGDLSDTITVLNFGEKISEGTYEHISQDPPVVEAYLGKDDEA